MSKAPATPKSVLVDDLADMGLGGRHVMVHSSYRLLAPVEDGPRGVLDAFVEAVGPRGILLFPTYDFTSWTERGYWDRDNTPSQMGIISETARTDSRFRRTAHRVLSYAVSDGASDAADFQDYIRDPVNAHGPNSIFDVLVRNEGIIISIGAEKQTGFRANDVGFTISNHAAVIANASWRRAQIFEGLYASNGYCSIKRYALSINADPLRYTTEVAPAHLAAEKAGIIRRMPLGRTFCWVAYAREFVEWAVTSHKVNPELWRRKL